MKRGKLQLPLVNVLIFEIAEANSSEIEAGEAEMISL